MRAESIVKDINGIQRLSETAKDLKMFSFLYNYNTDKSEHDIFKLEPLSVTIVTQMYMII